ncbi:PIN domain-containing protein [Neomoorella carbonis]|uniref:PIN domain-containing protein n=1 Tax=Neomoorella carbonis TaxID=3062783 RepID=UPI0032475FAF
MVLETELCGVLVDTDFLIDLNRGKGNKWRRRAEKLLLEINSADLFVSNITVTEFVTGIPREKQEEAQHMLQQLYYYIAPTCEEAILAGTLRQEWLRKGYSLSIADVTNAALAISRKLVLVTRNTKHYPFEQLLIKSW